MIEFGFVLFLIGVGLACWASYISGYRRGQNSGIAIARDDQNRLAYIYRLYPRLRDPTETHIRCLPYHKGVDHSRMLSGLGSGKYLIVIARYDLNTCLVARERSFVLTVTAEGKVIEE